MNYIPKFEYEHSTLGTTEVILSLPPQSDPLKEKFVTKGRETRSSSGNDQWQFNYTDQSFTLDLVFVEKDIKDQLKTMYDEVGSKGKSFKYFPSNDEVTSFTVILARKNFDPKRTIASGDDFIYDISISLRVKI